MSTAVVALADAGDPPHFDVIVPGLALGNEVAAHDRALLRERGVVAMINATQRDNPWAELLRKRGVACMQVAVEDRRTVELYPFFEPCCAFITRALEAAAGASSAATSPCVLVHCEMGTSRSVTIVVAYLMASFRLTLREALNFVLDHRPPSSPYTHPNPAFLMQLVRWEASLGLVPPGGSPSLEFLEYAQGAAVEWNGRNRGPCAAAGCRCGALPTPTEEAEGRG